MIRFRLPGWCIAIAVFLAATFTICAIAKMAIDLMAEDSHAPWLLYLLWFLLLAMFWSGLSLLRWRSNLAIAILLLSLIYAMPLGLFILIFRMVDD
jgi:hypothetical protein